MAHISSSPYSENSPNRHMDSPHTPPVVGIVGTLGTFTLADVNTLVGIGVGVVTLIYMIVKLIQQLKK